MPILDNLPENTMGEKIKKYRLLRGLTQKDLSIQTNIKGSAIGTYETDKIYPPMEKLEKIAEALDVDTNVFMDDYYIFISNNPKSFFKDLLVKNNLTVKEISNFLGVHKTMYNRWLDGMLIRRDTYYKIKNKLVQLTTKEP
ncbi:helix-turn-helix transcriptional regulator [Clostridium botulinum]|uniref:Helix-turn-helix transcriptional regulator n=1 Tax=Clostridium botulinum TaxID=1491 RepID=A0A6G4HNC8_CLOBO|nr:helix-turn-helix transcriptional regulator [Clostridium botulinum]NFQ62997.1 helix-turn-helix transcriptional regulator [Clostridium botulinum]NFR18900.1 helix-turn-helix transcriptional regulator [Clostridium botulinum]NFU17204.1 helix-turn-helix transcriptional regulator [Clostridium botulinum]NFU19910.1 helix-turn-helix transcriptional regulator [Clostridium botulinum]